MKFPSKSTGLNCTHFLLLLLVHCCALGLVSSESNGEQGNKLLSNTLVTSSLSKETVNAKDALTVHKRNVPNGAFQQKLPGQMYASPLEAEKARQFCQQLISHSRSLSSENGPVGLVQHLNGQDSGPVRGGGAQEEQGQITPSWCRSLLFVTSQKENQRVEEGKGPLRDMSSAVQHQQHKHSKRAADYDYSGENPDTFSKKLDFLFGNEGIRFKRNNATGSGSSYLVRLYVQPSTTKPGHLLQRLSRLGSTVAFNPSTVVMSTGTTPSGTTTLSPTSATPLLSDDLASGASSHSPKESPTPAGSNHSMQHFQPRRPTLIGQLLMLHRLGELSNRDYPPTSWMLYNNHHQFEKGTPVSAEPALLDADFGNSAEQSTRFVKNLVKKNPFDKEGIRFKRGSGSDAELSSFELSNTGYPFANEGIRFKKSPFDDEGIRYKKSSPFAEEGIRYKKSPFDEEGIRYKKSSPFAEEGIRFKKSPFDEEGIRYKKSPFDAEGIRFKKSPFDEEGIRYKKSPFDEEGIRY